MARSMTIYSKLNDILSSFSNLKNALTSFFPSNFQCSPSLRRWFGFTISLCAIIRTSVSNGSAECFFSETVFSFWEIAPKWPEITARNYIWIVRTQFLLRWKQFFWKYYSWKQFHQIIPGMYSILTQSLI